MKLNTTNNIVFYETFSTNPRIRGLFVLFVYYWLNHVGIPFKNERINNFAKMTKHFSYLHRYSKHQILIVLIDTTFFFFCRYFNINLVLGHETYFLMGMLQLMLIDEMHVKAVSFTTNSFAIRFITFSSEMFVQIQRGSIPNTCVDIKTFIAPIETPSDVIEPIYPTIRYTSWTNLRFSASS